MKEFRTDKAVIRIHGSTEQRKVEEATLRFLREAEKQRREIKK